MQLIFQWLLLGCLFFIDVYTLGSFGVPFFNGVLNHTIITFLFYSYGPLFYAGFLLLGLESFIVFDFFGFNYLYLIPLFTLFGLLRHYLASKEIASLIMLILAICCQKIFLGYFKLDQLILGRYTMYQISASLLVLFISLKWFSTVE